MLALGLQRQRKEPLGRQRGLEKLLRTQRGVQGRTPLLLLTLRGCWLAGQTGE